MAAGRIKQKEKQGKGGRAEKGLRRQGRNHIWQMAGKRRNVKWARGSVVERPLCKRKVAGAIPAESIPTYRGGHHINDRDWMGGFIRERGADWFGVQKLWPRRQ